MAAGGGAVQVLVGPNAATDASAFLTQVTNFTTAVNQLKAAGNKLNNPSEWQGKSATQFDTDYAAFLKSVALMETSLDKMAKGAQTVINNIDTTDSTGAASIGTFSG